MLGRLFDLFERLLDLLGRLFALLGELLVEMQETACVRAVAAQGGGAAVAGLVIAAGVVTANI